MWHEGTLTDRLLGVQPIPNRLSALCLFKYQTLFQSLLKHSFIVALIHLFNASLIETRWELYCRWLKKCKNYGFINLWETNLIFNYKKLKKNVIMVTIIHHIITKMPHIYKCVPQCVCLQFYLHYSKITR